MLLDGADVILIDLISWGGFGGHYHATDKVLDMYYLGIEAFVAFRWVNPWAKWVAICAVHTAHDRLRHLRGDRREDRALHLSQLVRELVAVLRSRVPLLAQIGAKFLANDAHPAWSPVDPEDGTGVPPALC